jgi:signal transduction histidine kinase
MKLKTFMATYLLFLAVLFSSVAIVSFYLNNSQIVMLTDISTSQFQTITSSLGRDVSVLWGRESGRGLTNSAFYEAVDVLVRGYSRYYSRHNIDISVIDTRLIANEPPPAQILFQTKDEGYFIFITGLLAEPFGYFLLEYRLDITENILEMRNIQNTLLISVMGFSVIAAIGLYLILTKIFQPLMVVAKTSRKIASGKFNERIPIKTNNELAQVAIDFNKMAGRIEEQMILLEDEAINKQQFVDNFAHEMRTPLTSIYGYAEYMHKAILEDGEAVELSERIMNRAGYLQEIANSLLQLAMLRDYAPNKKEIQVQHLFDDITQTIKVPMEDAGIKFVCTPNADVIYGQEDLIKSLLLNLCLNALKACAPNKGTIYMEAKNIDGGISLSVTDNGCGIPVDSRSKVTEPFYRVDKARNRKDGGAGLGLALCKKIAEVHGAEMNIESEVGVGTIVKIIFYNFVTTQR